MEPASFVLGVIGSLTGTTGVVLGVLNYLRDRVSAEISLQWDFVTIDGNNKPTQSPAMGVVSIVNTGRHPLYIKLVYLDVPKRPDKETKEGFILRKSLAGQKIGEADPDFVIPLSNEVQLYLKEHFTTMETGLCCCRR